MPEEIIHFGQVVIRGVGSGSLKLKFYGYDANVVQELIPLVLSSRPGKSLMRLSNFMDQKGQLEIRTEAINETFKIHKIILYAKPIWSEFPG